MHAVNLFAYSLDSIRHATHHLVVVLYWSSLTAPNPRIKFTNRSQINTLPREQTCLQIYTCIGQSSTTYHELEGDPSMYSVLAQAHLQCVHASILQL